MSSKSVHIKLDFQVTHCSRLRHLLEYALECNCAAFSNSKFASDVSVDPCMLLHSRQSCQLCYTLMHVGSGVLR